MRVTEDVRKYAAKQGIKENEALESGMQQRRRRSVKKALRFTRMDDLAQMTGTASAQISRNQTYTI